MAAATRVPVAPGAAVPLVVANGTRRRVALRTLTGDADLFVSTAVDVTSTTGFPVTDTDIPLVLELGENESLFGAVAAATAATACVLPL